MRNLNKYLIVMIAGIFAVTTIVIGTKYTASRQPSQAVPEVSKEASAKTEQTANAAERLFLDETYVFLSDQISDAAIKVAETEIDQDSQAEVDLLKQAKTKWGIQKSLNELFEAPVLVGKTVNKEVAYQATTTDENKQQVATLLDASQLNDDFTKQVRVILGNGTDSSDSSDKTFENVNLDLLIPSYEDTPDVQHAKEVLSYVVQNGEVVSGFTMDGYLVAKNAIALVPEGDLKNTMLSQLHLVETVMDSMGVSYQ